MCDTSFEIVWEGANGGQALFYFENQDSYSWNGVPLMAVWLDSAMKAWLSTS